MFLLLIYIIVIVCNITACCDGRCVITLYHIIVYKLSEATAARCQQGSDIHVEFALVAIAVNMNIHVAKQI